MGLIIAASGHVHLTPGCKLRGMYARIFGFLLMFPLLVGPFVFYAVATPMAPLHPPGMLNGVAEGFFAEIVVDVVYVIVAILLGILLHRYQEAAAERDEQLLWNKLNRIDLADAAGPVEKSPAESNDERIQP
jgi:hypothetical protein